MPAPGFSRRRFLEAVLAGTAVASTGSAASRSLHPAERVERLPSRAKIKERILAGHREILDELKPTKAQLDRGLELHETSYVADVQGNVSVTSPYGLVGERLMTAEGLDRDRARPFESAHDPQWIAESSALYQLTGVQLGLEDVAHPDDNTFEKALELLARSSYVYQRRHDLIHVAGFDDILRARESGRPCTIQHLAAVGCFADADDPIRNLDLFFALGVRMSQLTYFQQNRLCCSWCQQEDTGLTELGKQVVHRMNELGVMVDVAHCGHRSAMETVEASSEPVLISHTGCKAVYDDATNEQYLNAVFAQPYARGVPRPEKTGSRNAEDELLRAVAAKGGVAAFYTIGYVLGTGPELFDLWYRHLNHAIGVAGIDHVAIGTDRTFLPGWKPSPLDWTNWPYLTVGLVCRGHSDEEIRKILGANYLRYAERVLSKKPWGELMAPSGQRS